MTPAVGGASAAVAQNIAPPLADAAQTNASRRASNSRVPVASARADAPPAPKRPIRATPVAPSVAPLDSRSLSTGPGGGDEPDAGGSPEAETDPLVSNGLGSPLCSWAPEGEGLSSRSRSDCETSGFVAAAAPTASFGIDVHIDTGTLGLGSGALLVAVQDIGVTPLWTALVWAVHALLVMLEWCFTIDLLDSASIGTGLARGLRQMQAMFTVPWLATVFAVAAVLTAFNGLVRRRVAETLGQALLALAMMAGGSWVMVDPVGTIGALSGWANEASLGTLAVTARGTPTGGGRALADSMGTVFAAAIEVPWCYLEFGDVGWCRNPHRLDHRLRAAARTIAASELARVGCKADARSTECAAPGDAEAKALEHSATLLRSAQTNGAVFLALPANGPQRNAINDQGSLLRAICENDDATNCRGPTAAEAEFRTSHGTWGRVAGLALILAGVLGMLLLLGFLAIRLLASALFSLLYLMLAPMAVLAPALGDGGRAVFRKWAGQLLGAVVSKLLYSFLLGAILAILGILANLEALGWWTQWLLMSVFWWGAFARRHQAMQLAVGALGREQTHSQRSITRRMSDAFDPSRKLLDRAQTVKRRRSKRSPEVVRATPGASRRRGEEGRSEQARRILEVEHGDAHALLERAPEIDERATAMRAQLSRVRSGQASARAAGDSRRVARLASRGERVEAELGREQLGLESARRFLGDHGRGQGVSIGASFRAETAGARDRFLDAQAALAPAAASRGLPAESRRDYAALAPLVGYGPRSYERLGARDQRKARLKIDRELAWRSEQSRLQQAPASAADAATQRQARLARREHSGRAREAWRSGVAPRPPDAPKSESRVMREAREVADRRKRQLGSDRA